VAKHALNEAVELWLGPLWLNLSQALELIARVRDVDLNAVAGSEYVGISRALTYLDKASNSGVRCCYASEAAPHVGVGVHRISIVINAADLVEYLKRPCRGPRAGTVSRYTMADRALFPEMARIMRDDHISASAAAQRLVEAGKVAGTGADDSRARRLAKAYRAETR
jgi:hypothetical protein